MWFKGILRRKSSDAVLFDEVFLRRLERLSLQAQRTLRGCSLDGVHGSVRQVPATLFSDHRPYSVGDEYRYVDWNAYGHQDELFVKLGTTQQAIRVHVLLDMSRSMAWGEPTKVRVAQQLAAMVGYLALAHHDTLEVVPFGTAALRPFGPARGKGQLVRLLRFVEGLQVCEQTALGRVLMSFAASQVCAGLVVVISDLLDSAGLVDGLRALPSPRWQVLVLHVLDRREWAPDVSGPIELEDAETGQRLSLVLDAAALAQYRETIVQWQEQIARLCAQRGAGYAQVFTDWPLEQAVVPYLRLRRLLG